MGRPPIGNRAMTPAERQRRRRHGITATVTKHVTKQDPTKPDATASVSTKPPPGSWVKLPATPLISMKEIEQWADELGVDFEDMQRLTKLLARNELDFWAWNPEEMARWLVQELGIAGLEDAQAAIETVLDEAYKAEETKD
jgi:hypothetical protein